MNVFETQILANRLAQDYILSHSNLNEQIAKCAGERDLSRVQIQGLVTATNHAANDVLRKSAEDKTYTFELADLDKVLGLLSDEPSSGAPLAKVASAIKSLNPPTAVGETLYKQAQLGSDEEQERRRRAVRQILHKIAEKAKADKRKIKAEKVGCMDKMASMVVDLTKQVKEYMLQGGYSYEEVKKYAHMLPEENEKIVDLIFTKVAENLEKLGEPFKGTLAKDKELTRETFKRSGAPVPEPNVTVINGAVPIAKTVLGITSEARNISEKDKMTHELDSLSSYATMMEKGLVDSVEVHKHLLQDLDSFHRSYMLEPDLSVTKTAGITTRFARLVGGGLLQTAKSAPAASATSAVGLSLKGLKSNVDKMQRGFRGSADPTKSDGDVSQQK